MLSGNQTRPPGPSRLAAVPEGVRFVRDPFASLSRQRQTYGRIVYIPYPTQPVCLLFAPDYIEQVLRTDANQYVKGAFTRRVFGAVEPESVSIVDGQKWRRQRDRLQPGFYPDRIEGYAGIMQDRTETVVTQWEDGSCIDLLSEMKRITLPVLTRSLLGINVSDEYSVIHETAELLFEKSDLSGYNGYLPDWVPTPTHLRFRRSVDRLHTFVEALIEERRTDKPAGDDLLSRLVRTESAEGPSLSETELRDSLISLLLAGHVSSAVTLTYAWYLLSSHPDDHQALVAEVDSALDGSAPGMGQLETLTYTLDVLKETMRLYPPIPSLVREPTTDVTIDGYDIPEGTVIGLPQWVVHRDPEWWEAPERFRPERWEKRDESDRHDFAYFPFGGGPRVCIGRRFALTEMQIVLAMMAQSVSLERISDESLDLALSISTHPKRPVRMTVRHR